MPNKFLHDFRHFQTEYWMIDKEAPIKNIFKCSGDEDEGFSDSQEPALLAKLVGIMSTAALAVALVEVPPVSASIALGVGKVVVDSFQPHGIDNHAF